MNATATGFHIRSKNAGPFWLTIDIFCDDAATFTRLCNDPRLGQPAIAGLLRADAQSIRSFRAAWANLLRESLT